MSVLDSDPEVRDARLAELTRGAVEREEKLAALEGERDGARDGRDRRERATGDDRRARARQAPRALNTRTISLSAMPRACASVG